MTLLDFTLTPDDFTRQRGTPWPSKVNNAKNYVPINKAKTYVPINALTAAGALTTLIDFTLTPDDFTRQWRTLSSERVNNVKNVPINALTAVGVLMTLTDFTLSNAR